MHSQVSYRIAVVALISFCLLVASYAIHFRTNSELIAASGLELGRITGSSTYRTHVKVQNLTNRHVQIERIIASCPCLSVKPNSFTLGPKELKTLNLELALFPVPQQYAGHDEWPLDVTMLPSVKGEKGTLAWHVTATVASPIRPGKSELAFENGEIVRIGKTVRWQNLAMGRVPLKCCSDVVAVSASCYSDAFSASVENLDGDYYLLLSPSFDLGVGVIRATCRLTAVTSRRETSFLDLPIRAIVQNDLVLESTEDSAVHARVGQVVRQRYVLRSRLGRPFEILDVGCDGEAIEAEKSVRWNEHEVNSQQSVELDVRAQRPGLLVQWITFHCRYSPVNDEPAITASLKARTQALAY